MNRVTVCQPLLMFYGTRVFRERFPVTVVERGVGIGGGLTSSFRNVLKQSVSKNRRHFLVLSRCNRPFGTVSDTVEFGDSLSNQSPDILSTVVERSVGDTQHDRQLVGVLCCRQQGHEECISLFRECRVTNFDCSGLLKIRCNFVDKD